MKKKKKESYWARLTKTKPSGSLKRAMEVDWYAPFIYYLNAAHYHCYDSICDSHSTAFCLEN